MRYTVQDGVRKLQFDGELLAESSSREPGRPRWVEFSLYRTLKGTFVIYRVGRSAIFHDKDCQTVARNRLSVADGAELPRDFVPCKSCRPTRLDMEGVYPETARHYAQTSETAKGIISSLTRFDDNGTAYLTNVARDLLALAAVKDDQIADAFYIEEIE
jgi:hypothetical protein